MTIDKIKLKDKNNTIYLPSTSYKDFYRNNFTIVYPNNGSKEAPANITVNSRYIIENPFPGYYVSCIGEIFVNGEWATLPFASQYWSSGHYGHGLSFGQLNDDKIILVTGSNLLMYNTATYRFNISGAIHTSAPNISTAPARIKVWKVGIIDE